jgi:hypothetical protein
MTVDHAVAEEDSVGGLSFGTAVTRSVGLVRPPVAIPVDPAGERRAENVAEVIVPLVDSARAGVIAAVRAIRHGPGEDAGREAQRQLEPAGNGPREEPGEVEGKKWPPAPPRDER